MDKLKMQTINKIDVNVERIGAIFPNCVTESVGADGKLIKVVDFDLLRQELSGFAVEGQEERYQFTWADKKKSILLANSPISKTLRPCREESVDFDKTKNLYIEGDNLDVLKLLQETYMGKVKMIYIDPPYNTGNDFVYEDDFAISSEEYFERSGASDDEGNRLFQNNDSNGRFHTDWLNMIYPRLKLARDLLTDDGVIFISIDNNELHNLQKACDEILGASNYIGTLAWESKTKSQNTLTAFNKLQPKIEYILLYTKGEKRRFNLIQKGTKEYNETDEKGAFRWFKMEPMNASGIRGRETMIYPILGLMPPNGKQWQIGIELVKELLDDGDVKIEDNSPLIKLRPNLERAEITEPFWGFFAKEIGTAESAKKELSSILEKHGFETVKPVELIKRLIFHSSEKNDIIIDFFSGSATTAHAVMQLNAEDGGNRKFIMVQLPEETPEDSEARKAGYNNICEIGKERIRRAGKKIADENRMLAPNLDIGFRVLKLDSSNMKPVYYNPEAVSQTLLSQFEDNIKEDRTPEDLLFQVMLDMGVDLSSPITVETLGGKKVFTVGGNNLICCFDPGITKDTVTAIAKAKPLYAVFRDSSFNSDDTMVSFDQIFATYSPTTERRVI